ncbi:MAG TPA: phosphoribosyl-AMP cyclohydrolase [Acidimicrobiales bacterium]
MSDERPVAALADLAFDDRGLIPAIAQDTDGRVLMVGWMNETTLRETLDIGRMVYWSRSRQERWAKGDTSGDVQIVKEAYVDCDADVLLFVVDQQGKGACATGNYSCFYRDLRALLPES